MADFVDIYGYWDYTNCLLVLFYKWR